MKSAKRENDANPEAAYALAYHAARKASTALVAQQGVTIFNTLAGHGFGKLIVGFAWEAAVKDADACAQRIKAAVEAGTR